jgi:hypothetical protein
MKTYLVFIIVCFMLCSCNNETKTAAAKKDSLNFPFTAKYSSNWQSFWCIQSFFDISCRKHTLIYLKPNSHF